MKISVPEEYDSHTVQRMLNFLYRGDYDNEIDTEAREISDSGELRELIPILSRGMSPILRIAARNLR